MIRMGPIPSAGYSMGPSQVISRGSPFLCPGQTLIASSPKTQLFVLGTSRVLDPGLPHSGGDALISNALAYLSKDEILLGIRSKGEIIDR